MTVEKDLIEFDDSDAIRFIMNTMKADIRAELDDDKVQYVLDLLCEYYEENNLIDDDTVEEAEIAEDDVFNFISHLAKKEGVFDLSDEQLMAILDGEYRYGISIGIYSTTED